jgi:hypothetical protein
MAEIDLDKKRRAWELAHKLITLGRIVSEKEGKDMLYVGTGEFCRAMGQPDGAGLEEVREFVLEVAEFMRGYDMYMVCGCGYLFMSVCKERTRDQALDEDRGLTSFTPVSVDNYFDEYIMNIHWSKDNRVRQTCDVNENTNR